MSTLANTTAKLFVTDYASYNAGLQFVCGQWYDLEDYNDASELYDAITEHYNNEADEQVKELFNKDENEEIEISDLELMFTDFEGFPDSLYSESLNESELNEIIEFSNLDEEEREKIDAFVNCFGGDIKQALEKYEDAFAGQYDSDEDFAQDMAEQTGINLNQGWPFNCIDWEQAARELMFDYHCDNGFYFSANW